MKKISIKNIHLILIISIGLIGLGIGSTYAMFTSTSNIDNPISLSSNLSYEKDIFESFDITLSSKANKTIKFNINNNTQIESIKYATWYIYDGNDNDLSFYTSIDDTSDIEPNGTLSSTGGTINIKIVNNTNKKVKLVIGVSTSKDNIILPDYMKLISSNNEPKTTLVDYITNLYTNADKSTVTNNSITYNYASSVSLMNDRLGGKSSLDGGNIRYYGASPNNYIFFNCEEYPDTNCETWRIIGVFDGKVKIMRNESIKSLTWNTSYVNEWSTSKLMKLLNPGYETESAGGSLYYNNSSGNCYNTSDGTYSCDFTGVGIKNDATKNKIIEVKWNLGGTDSAGYSNLIYEKERGTTVYSGRSTTWTGKVVLPYPSDYGYSADFNSCSKTLANYNYVGCDDTSWMYYIFVVNSYCRSPWLLTPDSGSDFRALKVSCHEVEITNVENTGGIYPTLFLNSTETIYEDNAGTLGAENNPYKLNP